MYCNSILLVGILYKYMFKKCQSRNWLLLKVSKAESVSSVTVRGIVFAAHFMLMLIQREAFVVAYRRQHMTKHDDRNYTTEHKEIFPERRKSFISWKL